MSAVVMPCFSINSRIPSRMTDDCLATSSSACVCNFAIQLYARKRSHGSLQCCQWPYYATPLLIEQQSSLSIQLLFPP